MSKASHRHWAGVDWGNKAHSVCVVGAEGEVEAQVVVPHTAEGIEKGMRVFDVLGTPGFLMSLCGDGTVLLM